MTSSELRASFLDYFARHGHKVVPSSPLVPHGDTTLLFTNAGMNQFKDVFLGRDQRSYSRAATAQKCMRVSGKHNDLDNVGPSLRHHTFFEMLGNFSFGDYFKRDAIGFAWELLTDGWGLPPDRLHATTFAGDAAIPRDDDAHARWRDFLPGERIHELGADDNFWSMGDTGPCGRCSEIHYFRGNELPCTAPVCLGPACDCERFVEVWNNVFMEFDRQTDGTLKPLPKPSIDTGMGLERIAAIKRGTLSNYDTDVFAPLLEAIANEVGPGRQGATPVRVGNTQDQARRARPGDLDEPVRDLEPGRGRPPARDDVPDRRRRAPEQRVAGLRAPEDHAARDAPRQAARRHGAVPPPPGRRAGCADGRRVPGAPSGTRHHRASDPRRRGPLRCRAERWPAEARRATRDSRGHGHVVPGDEAFKLYDTFGLPLDFIEDLAGERKLTLDRQAFDRAMEAQRDKARAKSAFDRKADEFVFGAPTTPDSLRGVGDHFEGYTTTDVSGARIVALFDDQKRQVAELLMGGTGYVALDQTPFYVEAGGQVSDTGVLQNEAGRRARPRGRCGPPRRRACPAATTCRSPGGRSRKGSRSARSSRPRSAMRRGGITRPRTCFMRRSSGPRHARETGGSLVAPDRLRFDFTHFAALTPAEIEASSGSSTSRSIATRTSQPRCAIPTKRWPPARWRSSARIRRTRACRDRAGLQRRAVWRHAYARDRRYRLLHDHGESGVAAGVRRIEAQDGRRRGPRAPGPPRRRCGSAGRAERERRAGAGGGGEAAAGRAAPGARSPRPESQEPRSAARFVGRRRHRGCRRREGDPSNVAGLDKGALRELADSLKAKLKSGVVVLASPNEEGRVAIVASVRPI